MGTVWLGAAILSLLSLFIDKSLGQLQFPNSSYTTTCEENSEVDISLTTVEATDSTGALLDYSIENNPWFKINNSGVVKVKSVIDAEDPAVDEYQSYIVTVTDRSNPSRSATTTLSVHIEDVNEDRPRWRPREIYRADLFDGDPPGTVVVQTSATDRDRDSSLVYDIPPETSLGAGFPYLKIDNHTGLVTVAQTVDIVDAKDKQNGRNPFLFKVRVSDGRYLMFATILITMSEKNHIPPAFDETVIRANVQENQASGFVATVRATDDQEDPVQEVVFSIPQQAVPGYEYLQVDNSANNNVGVITLVSGLDREKIPGGVIEQVITVEDDGNPGPVLTSTATLIITVIDVNDNVPQYDIEEVDLRISQEYLAGDTFTLPLATDDDEGENARVIYKLSSEAEQYFTINSDTSVITTRTDCGQDCVRLVDCAWKSITVYAFNDGTPQANDSLTVNIALTAPSSPASNTPVKDLISCAEAPIPNVYDPEFSMDPYIVSMAEDTPIGDVVVRVSASDDDHGVSGQLNYTTDSDLFGITSEGTIYTKSTLDYEDPAQRRTCIEVTATDGGSPPRSGTAEVCINLVNVNDNRPVFNQTVYNAKLRNGDGDGTDVITITATDADGTTGIRYQLVGTNSFLRIDENTGQISVAGRIIKSDILNGAPGDSVQITVRAIDGRLTAETSLNLTIESSNLYAPVFAEPVINTTINEGEISRVLTLVATDEDVPSQNVRYEMADATFNGVFQVSPTDGSFSVISSIDRENLQTSMAGGSFPVHVLAVDDGIPVQRTATATINIIIGDINDNAPQFSTASYELRLNEDFTPGITFQLPDATDRDIGENARIVYNTSTNVDQVFRASGNTVTTSVTCDKGCVKTEDCSLLQFTLWAYNADIPDARSALTVSVSLLKTGSTRSVTADPAGLPNCSALPSPNDNEPIFSKPNYSGDVTEGSPTNTLVAVVNATDGDYGESGDVVYTITNSTDFAINENGEVVTRRDLDYENPDDRRICIEIRATDKGRPPRSSSTAVCIDLINANDNIPRFNRQLFQVSVYDEATAGTYVRAVTATDLDPGSSLVYSFLSPNDYFQIDPLSGNVTVLKTINRIEILRTNPGAVVNIRVSASDGQNSAQADLEISVLQINKFAPEFDQNVYSASIDEGVFNEDVILITALDSDVPPQESTYRILNVSSVFSINPSTGQIRIDQPLDREAMTGDSVTLLVVAQDGGDPPPQRSATATVRIQINDVNENKPLFNQDFFDLRIYQNFTSGNIFPLPTAMDSDVSSVIQYGISDEAGSLFTFNQTTGEVKTKTGCEESCVKLTDCHMMTFTVWAYNPDKPSDRDVLRVNLTLLTLAGTPSTSADIPACSDAPPPNDNDPTFSKPTYEGKFPEGVPPNTIVINVTASDDDFGESGDVIYSITNSTDFGINENGSIYTINDLDYENPSDRKICMQVLATDKGRPPRSSSTVVCLDLLDSNDNRPSFTSIFYEADVFDADPVGTFVTAISATDRDANTSMTYDFVQQNEYFQIDPQSGNVTVSKVIDRADILLSSPNDLVIVQVSAFDGKYREITQLRISVKDTNKFPPVFDRTLYTADVDEEVSGIDVILITATDADRPVQEITYRVLNQSIPGAFSVNPSSGQIRIEQAIDRESLTADKLEVVIEAVDSGPKPRGTATTTVLVTINDVNDNKPQFGQDFYDLQIFQNFTRGNQFSLPTAVDDDPNSVIVYELSANANDFFTIDPSSGEVTTKSACDKSCVKLSDCHMMTFTLSAYNPDNPSQRDFLQVNLTLLALTGAKSSPSNIQACSDSPPPNDNDPTFSKPTYEGKFPEGVPPNTIVINVTASDDDFGESGDVIYSITNSTDFGINENGSIYTINDLDYENPSDRKICMQVLATDKGRPPRSSSTVVCLDLLDSNDNRPSFTSIFYEADVFDADPVGTFVTAISATDRDANTTMTYDIVQGNEYFQIDPQSGNVTVSKAIDRADILLSSPNDLVIVQVSAFDGKYREITRLRISVKDTNKFPPVFDRTLYTADVDEEVSGIDVILITATDADRPAQEITYRVLNQSIPGAFSVNPSSGQIRIEQAIDRESLTADKLEVVIEAVDSGPKPRGTATTTVLVTINDVNDNRPQFGQDFYDLQIFQNFTRGNQFSLPTAVDDDPNSVIVYELSANANDFFTIDPSSGVVTTKTACDKSCVKLSDCHMMTFTLSAYNPDNPTQRDFLQVNLTLLALTGARSSPSNIQACSDSPPPNDNDPTFSKPTYEGKFPEGVPPNTIVINVTASDDDFGESGDVIYSITNSTDFGINENGSVYTINDLDYENPSDRKICMQVLATDKGRPPRSSSTVVCLDLLDSNDNRPSFTRIFYEADVFDADPVGTFVTAISATDRDANTTMTYDFVQQNEYFQIDPQSGNVTVSKVIDRADILLSLPNDLVIVQVSAYDGKYREITQLRISVKDTNKFSPVFDRTLYTADVDEEVSGIDVILITATDADRPVQEITYRVLNQSIPGAFSMNPSSGQIRVEQAIDRESLTADKLEVVIEAVDSGPKPRGTSTATVLVTINDVNDNKPQFGQDFYDLQIFQNFTRGNQFSLPTAVDDDPNSVILYELSANANDFFTIDPSSGVVTTKTACDKSCVKLSDCHMMTFTLSAYNPDNPTQRDFLQVNLTLLALTGARSSPSNIQACSDSPPPNDNDPTFSKPTYEGKFPEGVPPNTIVINVTASDDDFGESGDVIYSITNSTDFGINENGSVYTINDLDYENPSDRKICMQVLATDKGRPPRSSSTVVCLDLLDSNDNRPSFTRIFYEADVFDADPVGTFVTAISATDRDANTTMTYDFVQQNEYFQIDPQSGNVTVSKVIDRAGILLSRPNGLVIVQVSAYDGKYREITQLRISVRETNKFAPVFGRRVYTTDVDENVAGRDVILITATDADRPAQRITYRLLNQAVPGTFSVNVLSGQIRIELPLDRDTMTADLMELLVEATDSGPDPRRSATATVQITINDVNDNRPQFSQDFYNLRIFQNFTIGSSFPLPTAVDNDVTGVVRYELSQNARDFFTIDPITGVVETKGSCGDSCVKLTDCHRLAFSVSAYNPDDPTQRDTLRVNLTLLSLTGGRTSAADIPACSDALSPNNNDPAFSQPGYDATVPEDITTATPVLTVNATDADYGDSGRVVYTVTNSTDFRINENGVIFTTRPLDYENPNDRRICFQVVAEDMGRTPRSASTVVCVTITNTNEHRPIFPSTVLSGVVYDRDEAGTFVVRIVAQDADSDSIVIYNFPSRSDYFAIDASSGNVTVAKKINRRDALGTSGNDFVPVPVTATDGQFSSSAELRITIIEKNEFPPRFSKSEYSVSVTEESVSNPLITVPATDEDRVDEDITYSIANVSIPNVFSIGTKTGEILMSRVIDRESLSTDVVEIVVVATDSGRPSPQRSSSATVSVSVLDINDNSPQFVPNVFTLQVHQNFSKGDIFLIPTASDPDSNDVIEYKLSPIDPWFEVDPNTGALRMRGDCGESCEKIEDCNYGELTVMAFNPDRTSMRAELKVNVILLTTATDDKVVSPSGVLVSCSDAKTPNRNSPKFDKPNYKANVTENSPTRTVVVKVTASDNDFGDSGDVVYSVTNSTDYGIDENGEIYVVKSPDHESPDGNVDCIQVEASDKGTPPRKSYAVVCIDVTDENDNNPAFTEARYRGSAQDGDLPGKFVIQVSATDDDPGTTITYSIDTLNPSPYFQIDRNSGNITVAQTIDRAAIMASRGSNIVSVRVVASDSQREQSTVVLITIQSQNEHAPRFDSDQYTAIVREEATDPNVVVVQASDDDLPRQPVTYSIQSSNMSDHFRINSNGQISLVKTIDRESLNSDSLSIVVVATDSGNPAPKRSSSATVLVHIRDTNDNAPKFAKNSVEIRLPQNFTSGLLRQLPTATDADVGGNARIAYQLSRGVDLYFSLDEDTALLRTRRGCLDCRAANDFEWLVFTVTAYNPDRPAVTDQLQVRVILTTLGNGTEEPIAAPVVLSESVTVNRATAKPGDMVFSLEKIVGEGVTPNFTLAADNLTLSIFSMDPDGGVRLKFVPRTAQKTYTMRVHAIRDDGKTMNMTLNLLVNFSDDTYLDEKGIAAISAICAIALLIIILAIVHIIWWKTRHKKDKDEVLEDESTRGCCCGKPLVAIQFTGESSL